MGWLLGKLLQRLLTNDNEDSASGNIIAMLIPVFVFIGDGLGFLLLIFIPLFVLISLPLILFGLLGGGSTQTKADLLGTYQNMPTVVRHEIDNWIDYTKQNVYFDEIIINDDYNVDPNMLMCIDAVRYKQDFRFITYDGIYNTCCAFFTKDYSVVTHTVSVDYYDPVLDDEGIPVVDEKGVPKYTKTTVDEERYQLTINVKMRSLEFVFQDLGVDPQAVYYMYNNTYLYQASDFKEITPEEIRARKLLMDTVPVTRQELIDTGYQLLGKVPYFWGGKSPAGWNDQWGVNTLVSAPGSPTSGTMRPFGLDCSGYVDWVFKTANVTNALGGDTSYIWNQSYPVSRYELKPGDLVFELYPGTPGSNHVGIYVNTLNGVNYYLHCASGKNNVVYDSYSNFRYYRRVFVKFKGD